jgi:hypothetical protein
MMISFVCDKTPKGKEKQSRAVGGYYVNIFVTTQ